MSILPIILDTDIGDDIDDALALSVILNSPELDLRGVTTVFEKRASPRGFGGSFIESLETQKCAGFRRLFQATFTTI